MMANKHDPVLILSLFAASRRSVEQVDRKGNDNIRPRWLYDACAKNSNFHACWRMKSTKSSCAATKA